MFIGTMLFTFPRQHRFQKSNAKCNTKICPVLCFSVNRNCAQPINLYRTAEEPEVDWWLWFDCDTFFMNMTATWFKFKPGNCIRVGREVCSEVRINYYVESQICQYHWGYSCQDVSGLSMNSACRFSSHICSAVLRSFATLWAHWISGCYQRYWFCIDLYFGTCCLDDLSNNGSRNIQRKPTKRSKVSCLSLQKFEFNSNMMISVLTETWEHIVDQLIGSLSNYLRGFVYPGWCRMSSTNSMLNKTVRLKWIVAS